jgi:hypothetical protein
MNTAYRFVLAGIAILLAASLALKCVLPLVIMYTRGVGVEMPFPKGLAKKYPRLAITWFVIGAPILCLFLLAATLYILLHR